MPHNPLSFGNYDLSDSTQQKLFLQQLSVSLNQLYQPSFIASLINGSALLNGTAFSTVNADLGTITTDQTVDCKSAMFINVALTSAVNQTRTLTLNNLISGALVKLDVVDSANSLTFKMAANTPGSVAYAISAWLSTNGSITNLVSTGYPLSAGISLCFVGTAGVVGGSPRLDMIFA
jgi:hypothetical protein